MSRRSVNGLGGWEDRPTFRPWAVDASLEPETEVCEPPCIRGEAEVSDQPLVAGV